MSNAIEESLYFDPQNEKWAECPRCGGAIYPPGYRCIRCERGDAP